MKTRPSTISSTLFLAIGIFLVVVLLLPSYEIAATPTVVPGGKIRVFVSILPQLDFVEHIGSSFVEAEVLVGPGQSHETFEPTPQQVSRLAAARVYFCIGVPFEQALLLKTSVALNNVLVIDTSVGIPRLPMAEPEEGAGGLDFHTWLAPANVKVQAGNICQALCKIDPTHADHYRQNLRFFQAELDRLSEDIARILAPLKGRAFFVFHPAFGYFGQAYGLKQVAVETGGKEPGARRLAQLIDRAKRERVRVIFVQPQFSAKSAEAIARAIGGVVVPIDPLPRDYLRSLEDMAKKIESGLGNE